MASTFSSISSTDSALHASSITSFSSSEYSLISSRKSLKTVSRCSDMSTPAALVASFNFSVSANFFSVDYLGPEPDFEIGYTKDVVVKWIEKCQNV